MCGKLSNACQGDTSSAEEQCKDVSKTTQHLPIPKTFFLVGGGGGGGGGRYDTPISIPGPLFFPFGVVMIKRVESFITPI